MSEIDVGLLEELPVHPETRVVQLTNGLTCWLRRHPRPEGTVGLALHVACGSLNEDDDELGLSHFLEHLAFHGSAHFPPGAMLELFESLGTRLGRDHNASTGLERTTFSLLLPGNARDTVDAGLLCLADFAFGLSLLPRAVEAERQVILEEMRARGGARSRIRERVLDLLAPGSRVATRHPLGSEAVVASVTPARLGAYYARWYRPGRATLVATGDIDGAELETLVEARFGKWRADRPEPPEAESGIGPTSGRRIALISDPEVRDLQVRLVAIRRRPRPATVAELRAELVAEMARWLVNRRLARRLQLGEACFREARVGAARLVGEWQVTRASAAGRVGDGEAILAELVTELRRIADHGVDDSELELARRHHLSVAWQAALGEGNRRAEAILREMGRAIADRRPPMSRTQSHRLVEELLPGIEEAELVASVASSFDPDAALVAAIVPEGDGSLTTSDLASVLHRVEARPTTPPAPIAHRARLLPAPPKPGTVASECDLRGTVSLVLGNDVHLHLRSSDYRVHRVFVEVTIGGGRIREREHEVGLTAAAALAFTEPSCAGLGPVAIREALTGRGVTLESVVDEDAIALRLAADPAELEAGLELLHLLLSRPRVEEQALARWHRLVAEQEAARSLSVEAELAIEALRLLTGDDHRFRLISSEQAEAIGVAGAQAWLDDLVARAPIEAAIVGDLERERALELGLRYLGSLAPRTFDDPQLKAGRELEVTAGPLVTRLSTAATTHRAAVLEGWRGPPWSAAEERRLLQMAEQLLSVRLRQELRQERGLTYSAECSFKPSKAYPAAALFSVAFYSPPERADEAAGAARSVVEALAAVGPSEAELEGVRRQFVDLVRRVERDPKYWARVLADLDYHGTDLAELDGLEPWLASVEAEAIRRTLAHYAVDAGRIRVVCLPSSPGRV